MAGFVTDNEFEIELNKMLLFLDRLKQEQTVFSSTHAQLETKERVRLIQKILTDHKKIETFLERIKHQDLHNSGVRFKLENLRTRYSSLRGQWRKFEKLED